MGKKIYQDNKGFSLVELIVTVLITAILMLAVTMFISTSRSAYQTVNTSATLQEEAMTVERVFSESLMEAKAYGLETGISFSSGGETITADILWTKAKENDQVSVTEDDSIYCFLLDKSAHQIRYYKDIGDATGMISGGHLTTAGKTKLESECFGANTKYSLIADHVESMTMNIISRPDGTDLVVMQVDYEYMGKTYISNLTTVTRNATHAATIPAPVPTGEASPTPEPTGEVSPTADPSTP